MRKCLSTLLALLLCVSLTVPALATEDASYNRTVVSPVAVGYILSFIKNDGTLWTQGNSNFRGSLGIGEDRTGFITGSNKILDDAIFVSTSGFHGAAITSDHTLWMWGENWAGQLGTGDVYNRYTPTKILDDVISVCCSGTHTLAIKADGSLWAWGWNYYGEVGVDETNYSYEQYTNDVVSCQTVPIKIMDNVVVASCQGHNSAAIKADGTLWLWGDNTTGQLGAGVVTNRSRTQVNGIVNPYQTTPIKVMENVVDVSCGDSTYVIKTDGSLWAWGVNDYGQLGNNGACDVPESFNARAHQTTPVKIMDGVTSVHNNGFSAMALKADGSLWTWGENYSGNIGNGKFGRNNDQYVPVNVLNEVVFMSGSSSNTVAIKKDGSLWAWGSNSQKQFGDGFGNAGDEDIQTTPIKIMDGLAVPATVARKETPSSWAKSEVDAAIAAGLVPENLQKNYTKPVSRADVAQMFINLLEQGSGKNVEQIMSEKGVSVNSEAFTDTSDYAVLAANALGIINGTGNAKFSPNGTFTRAQIAAIINRVAGVSGIDTDGYSHSFTDVSEHWVSSELGWPSSVGIINGIGGSKFSPDTELTTEQAIAIAYRALQVLKER